MEQEAQKPGGEHTAEQRVRVTRNEVSDERNRIPTAELGGPRQGMLWDTVCLLLSQLCWLDTITVVGVQFRGVEEMNFQAELLLAPTPPAGSSW